MPYKLVRYILERTFNLYTGRTALFLTHWNKKTRDENIISITRDDILVLSFSSAFDSEKGLSLKCLDEESTFKFNFARYLFQNRKVAKDSEYKHARRNFEERKERGDKYR